MVIWTCMNGEDGVDSLWMILEENHYFPLNRKYVEFLC